MDALSGKKLLILGLARQGKALARFAVSRGAQVTISDLRPAEALSQEIEALRDLDVHFALGGHPHALLEACDLIALSGSVPPQAPFVRTAVARGIPLTNDSREFLRRSPAPLLSLTGSAGKTTTTSLLGEMGRAAGRTTWVGGNIGFPLIEKLDQIAAEDFVVQELSSFQLELWDASPAIAAVLNITPNHLDRHKTLEAYTAAKANILRFQTANDVAVLSADDPGARRLAPQVRGRLRTFSAQKPVADGAYIKNQTIFLADGAGNVQPVAPLSAIPLRGAHNVLNVLAACTLADSAGLPVSAMQQAIKSFRGVEHRLEHVATIDGVQYINDSIATAPERALAAIAAFNSEPLILLAGGQDKDMEWHSWVTTVSQRVKKVILFGALADMLAERLAQAPNRTAEIIRKDRLEEAIAAATAVAEPGDVVLLSPGGTSYDAFKDFVERGVLYRKIIKGITVRPRVNVT